MGGEEEGLKKVEGKGTITRIYLYEKHLFSIEDKNNSLLPCVIGMSQSHVTAHCGCGKVFKEQVDCKIAIH